MDVHNSYFEVNSELVVVLRMGNPLTELGLGSEDGALTVDHVLTLSLRNPNRTNINSGNDSTTSLDLDHSIRKALDAITQSSLDINRTFRIVGYALASYFVLSGVARIIEVFRTSKSIQNNRGETK